MKKYRCTICGYIYDEAVEKVKFADLPADWKCPLCGAPKEMFEEIIEEEKEEETKDNLTNVVNSEEEEDLRLLSNYEMSLICSNLAKGCEKQYLEEEEHLFKELASYYESKEDSNNGTFNDVLDKVNNDLNELSSAMDIASSVGDRGAKRVITWALKTSNVIKYIIENYQKNGVNYLKNTKIWVCDICGFVYSGNEVPSVCPICKVPSLKILEVK